MGYGFRPVRRLSGGAIVANKWLIATDYSSSIFAGDMVKIANTGFIVPAAANASADVLGAFYGCEYTKANGEKVFSKYWPASTDVNGNPVAYVYDSPDLVYKVEADQDTTAIVEADVGINFDIVATTGSTVTGYSGFVIDSSDQAASTNVAYRLLGSAELDGTYTAAGTAMDVYVMVAGHFLRIPAGV